MVNFQNSSNRLQQQHFSSFHSLVAPSRVASEGLHKASEKLLFRSKVCQIVEHSLTYLSLQSLLEVLLESSFESFRSEARLQNPLQPSILIAIESLAPELLEN